MKTFTAPRGICLVKMTFKTETTIKHQTSKKHEIINDIRAQQFKTMVVTPT